MWCFRAEITQSVPHPAPNIYEGMSTRRAQFDDDLALVRDILKFSPSERIAVIGLLHHRQTHRELAARDGITRNASRQRIKRARKRAKPHGVNIPNPRRSTVKRTLAEAGRLARN
jgi:DNA-directed RNA polymerase specialized sigma24 family protein